MKLAIVLLSIVALVSAQTVTVTTLNIGSAPVTPSFAGATTMEAADGTRGAASGDLDGDGDDEFVAGQNLTIYDWNGSGWDEYTVGNQAVKLDRYGGEIEVADIDNDGLKDIVTTDSSNASSTGAFLWYKNPGSLAGTWTENSESTWSGSDTGNSIRHAELECGDINGDGRVDVVFRDIAFGSWVFIRKSDNSGFETRNFIAHNAREGLALADVDDDGDLDIWINGAIWLTPADPVAGTYTLFEPIGIDTNWYPAANDSTTISQWACKVVAADLNGDTRPDMLIANSEELSSASGTKPEGIRVYLCPADPIGGTWTEVVVRASRYSWHNLRVADFNADGALDFIAAISLVGVDDDTPLETVLFLNNGAGTGWTEQEVQDTQPSYQLTLGDADGDGDKDFIQPHTFNSGAIRYYENTTTP